MLKLRIKILQVLEKPDNQGTTKGNISPQETKAAELLVSLPLHSESLSYGLQIGSEGPLVPFLVSWSEQGVY